MPVALVGLPGSGKSSVGHQLARRLQLDFFDSDQVIEQRLGCSIREFFEREGEPKFRSIEETVIAELCLNSQAVLATGGGVVLSSANRDCLHRHCRVVYLRAAPDDLYSRLRHDVKRPLLQVADPLRRLHELFAVRDRLYRETAHFVIQTGRPSMATLVNMIVMQLEMSGALPLN